MESPVSPGVYNGFVLSTRWLLCLLTLSVWHLGQWYIQKSVFKFHNDDDNLVSTYSLLFLNKKEMWAIWSQYQRANFKLYYIFDFLNFILPHFKLNFGYVIIYSGLLLLSYRHHFSQLNPRYIRNRCFLRKICLGLFSHQTSFVVILLWQEK